MKSHCISAGRYVTVSEFKDKFYVFFKDTPGSKGVTLNSTHFATLMYYAPDITKAVENFSDDVNFRKYLGDRIFVSVIYPYRVVNIRYFHPGRIATAIGMALKFHEWHELLRVVPILHKDNPGLAIAEPFVCTTEHISQIDYFGCNVCSPFNVV